MGKSRSTKSVFKDAVAAFPTGEKVLHNLTTSEGAGEVDFSPVDVAIIIALNEEFEAIRNQFKLPVSVGRPIQGVACTEFRFKQRVATEETHSFCVAVLGDMGEVEAALVTQYYLRDSPPKLIANLGISGATSKELKLGDVVVAQSVHRYLADSKTMDGESHKEEPIGNITGSTSNRVIARNRKMHKTRALDRNLGVFFDLAPRVYDNQLDVALFAGNFQSRNSGRYKQWQKSGTDNFENIIKEFEIKNKSDLKKYADGLKGLKSRGLVGLPPRVFRGPIGSGPGVCSSEELLRILRRHNRKLLAIDMESGGMMAALRRSRYRPAEIVLRGICDFADERKEQMEESTGRFVRAIAMGNVFRLFLNLLDDGLFNLAKAPARTEEGDSVSLVQD